MSKDETIKNAKLQTQMVRGGTIRSQFGEVSEAMWLNSGFSYDTAETAESRFNGEAPGYVYSRYLNPNLKMLEDRLAMLEGAEACCVMGSGMAAVFASMMSFLKCGDHVVANKVLFGSCFYIITEILPRYGISYTLVDGADQAAWEVAFQENTTAAFVESPANPTLALTDLRHVAELCKKHEVFFIVDNVFATPLYQKPLELGADAVIYSTTKHLDGQGRTLGGAVLGSESYIKDVLLPFHRHTGPAMSPFTAWLLIKSLETFTLRMERHTANAQIIAELLDGDAKVGRVHYPGLTNFPQHALANLQMSGYGAMIGIELKGGKEEAFRFMNALEIVDIANNLGDAKSLITHPGTTTHSNIAAEERIKLGITDNLLRLSVGIEDVDDLKDDITRALAAV